MSGVRRVPPPPPPGFGDEEYYRLYGRPEDYHRYRAKVESHLQHQATGSHQAEDGVARPRTAGRTRRSKSVSLEPGEELEEEEEEEEDSLGDETELSEFEGEPEHEIRIRTPPPRDLRYHPRISRRRGRRHLHSNEEVFHHVTPSGRRRYPPPPPEEFLRGEKAIGRSRIRERSRSRSPLGLEEDQDEMSSLEEAELSPPVHRKGSRKAFENFRVTIPNTRGKKSQGPGGRGEEDPSEGSLSLSEEGEEDVEQPVEKSRRSTPPPIPLPKVKSAKERLGKRVTPPITTTISVSSDDDTPPPPKSRRRQSPPKSTSRRRPMTPSSPDRSKSRSRGRRERRRSFTPPNSNGRSGKKKKRKKRNRNRGGNSSNLSQRMEDTNKENEIMLKKLARKRRGGPPTSESSRVKNLAKMAGIKIPSKKLIDASRDQKRPRKRSISPNPRNLTPKPGFGSKLRSDRITQDRQRPRGPRSESQDQIKDKGRKKAGGSRSPKRWKHDKFTEASPIREKEYSKEEDEATFGSHWSRIRSERSKERDRDGNLRRTRSRSRGKSAGSKKRKLGRKRRSRRSRSYSSSSDSSRSSSGSSRSSHRRRGRRSSHRRRKRSYSSYSRSSSRSSSSSSSRSSSSRSSRSRSVSPIPHPRRARKANNVSLAAASLAPPPAPPQASTSTAASSSKDGVNMQTSGKLLQDTNLVNGVVVKYCEPPDARKPRTKWRLYVFKGNEELPILYIHRQSCYLMGRDRKVADVPLDHPSCSKQHAVLQYRLLDFRRPDGSTGRRVTPYVMDLNSANGTFLNNQKIESQKFVQVLEKDVLKFGFSSREYVLLHDQSKDAEGDDPGVE
ncbi:hypothetical protein TCAL_11983 [Tigriopus californicus]|uniref:FHA domain-containing protein n=1 Tax=Tigriopus californicus TaxID=6832 RepID=A0A553NVX7_TIGCA|nr:hypothetical protein TCAL_11983 [Tigriopus californicus]